MKTIPRIGLLVLALAACAWFALGARQAHDTAVATALVSAPAPLSAEQVHRTRVLLDAAGTLNPDLSVDLLVGELDLDQHESTAAERIDESVTDKEPLSLDAWSALAFAAARAGDRRTLVRAARHVSELYPKLQ